MFGFLISIHKSALICDERARSVFPRCIYKKNAEKLVIRLFIEITGSDADGSVTDSLFDYLNALQQSGYRLSVHLEKGENSEIINARTDDEYIDREKISNALTGLGE